MDLRYLNRAGDFKHPRHYITLHCDYSFLFQTFSFLVFCFCFNLQGAIHSFFLCNIRLEDDVHHVAPLSINLRYRRRQRLSFSSRLYFLPRIT